MAKYRIIREDWFDHEDTVMCTCDSVEAAQRAIEKYRAEDSSQNSYYMYEIPPDGHEPMSYQEWLMAD